MPILLATIVGFYLLYYFIFFLIMQQHPYHLVDYRPWPILVSSAVFSLPIGLVFFIRESSVSLLALTLICILIISFVWWRDITREATFQGCHRMKVIAGLKIGVILFIISEIIFFFAFFWAYFHARLAPSIEIGSVWPPVGINTLVALQVPLLNTSVLLLSGVRVTWAHHAIVNKNLGNALQSLLVTVILGLYFIRLQYGEYTETTFNIRDRVYGSAFFVATGFHGLHVIVGTIFLSVCLSRLYHLHFRGTHHIGFLGAAWYWHFVDVVWLFLFVRVYWWGSNFQGSLD